jgi:hypothetical protein
MIEDNFCLWCNEKVDRLSSLIPQESHPMHVECYVRSTLDCENNPSLSKRDAAMAAYALYEERVAAVDRVIVGS